MVREMDHQPARRRFAACLQFSLILIRDLAKTALKPAGEHGQVDATAASWMTAPQAG